MSDVDPAGYLLDAAVWTTAFAEAAAATDQLTLTAAHWEILALLRAHYLTHGQAPPMRLLTRLIDKRLGADKANSRYLYRLFPDGPAKQACRYAGLPKPVSCI